MRKAHFYLMIITISIYIPACNTGNKKQTTDEKSASAVFDIQKARSFIDSINAKFTEEIKNGDSTALASHYGANAEILMSNSEPIRGKDILSTWGSMLRGGVNDMKFTTSDLTGNSDFLIETGIYEINDPNKKLIGKGNYVVIWKQQNGEWKLYRDIGVSSMPETVKN